VVLRVPTSRRRSSWLGEVGGVLLECCVEEKSGLGLGQWVGGATGRGWFTTDSGEEEAR